MSGARLTVGELLLRLEAEGLLGSEAIGAIHEDLIRGEAAPPAPWYVQALIGFGAWVAAIALLVALAITVEIRDGGMAIAVGAVLLAAGLAVHRGLKGTFAAQASLALCLAGEACIVGGIAESAGGASGAFVAAAGLAAGLYVPHRSPIHRFLTVLAAMVLAVVVIFEGQAFITRGPGESLRDLMVDLLLLAEAGAVGWILLAGDPPRALRPLLYSLAVSLLGTILALSFWREGGYGGPGWVARVGLIAGAIIAFARLGGGISALRREPLAIAAAAAVILGLISNHGIIAALSLAAIGYARGESLLAGLALAFVAPFLCLYYYDLHVSLLAKSGILAGSGLLLLAVRWWLARRPWSEEPQA